MDQGPIAKIMKSENVLLFPWKIIDLGRIISD